MLGDYKREAHAVLTSQRVDVQQGFARSGICARISSGLAGAFLFSLLHVDVPSTEADNRVPGLLHAGDTFLGQQRSGAAVPCGYSHERCFNKLLC